VVDFVDVLGQLAFGRSSNADAAITIGVALMISISWDWGHGMYPELFSIGRLRSARTACCWRRRTAWPGDSRSRGRENGADADRVLTSASTSSLRR
jgi:hypothetical protein